MNTSTKATKIDRKALKSAISDVTHSLGLIGKAGRKLTDEERAAREQKKADREARVNAMLDSLYVAVQTAKYTRQDGKVKRLNPNRRITMAFTLIQYDRPLPAEFLALADWSKVADTLVAIGAERKIDEDAVRRAFRLVTSEPVVQLAPSGAVITKRVDTQAKAEKAQGRGKKAA